MDRTHRSADDPRTRRAPRWLALFAVILFATAACRDGPAAPSGPPAANALDWIVDSVRTAFGVPAMGGAIVTLTDAHFASGVAGFRRASGGPLVTPADLWHIGSNFKAFTAVLAAVAVDQGKIQWSTRIRDVFPELAGAMDPGYHEVTLRDLLSHQSGLPRDPPVAVATFGFTRPEQRLRVTAWAVQVARSPSPFLYSNTGYMIAAAMIERALGTNFEQAIYAHVFQKLSINDVGFGPQAAAGSSSQPVAHTLGLSQWVELENHDNVPVYSSAGGAHMSIRSWARFLQEVLRIEAGSPTIVSVSAGRETTASLVPVGGQDHYGMGWLVTSRSWANGRALTHDGTNLGNHSVAWIAPERGFAVLAVTNSYDPGSPSLTWRALDALVARLIAYYLTGQ